MVLAAQEVELATGPVARPLGWCDQENGQGPDSEADNFLCYEEAVGRNDNLAKDQWAGIEALKRTRLG